MPSFRPSRPELDASRLDPIDLQVLNVAAKKTPFILQRSLLLRIIDPLTAVNIIE